MTGSRGTAYWLQRLSVFVALAATAAGSYVLLVDSGSGWFSRVMGAALLAFTVYLLWRVRDLNDDLGIVPAWRARNVWDVISPTAFPFWLASWAEERESALVWLGWALLVMAIAVQVAIWRVERPLARKAPQPAPAETHIRRGDAA